MALKWIFNSFFFICRKWDEVEYKEYISTCSVAGASTVEIRLTAQTDNHIFLLHQNILVVRMRLVGTGGKALPIDDITCLANNSIDSLFSKVSLQLGKTKITRSETDYPYKAYLSKLLSFPKDSKDTWMQTEMWAEDTIGHYDPIRFDHSCVGTMTRAQLFKERGKPHHRAQYTNEFITVYGHLTTDLSGCHQGIISGLSITLTLTFSSDGFRIVSNGLYPEQGIHLEVQNVHMHVPLAKMNMRLYKSIQARLSHETIKMFYNRLEVSKHLINKGTSKFGVKLFTNEDSVPCRIYIVFVDNKQYYGESIMSNPYWFRRNFSVTEEVPDNFTSPTLPLPIFDQGGGMFLLPPPPGEFASGPPNIKKTVTRSCFIQNMIFKINGSDITTLPLVEATENDDFRSYLKLNQVQGIQRKPFSVGITYQKWLDNSAIYAFDLSTSSKCSETQDLFCPVVRSGRCVY